MLFNSFQFLFFFPCVFLLYYALPFRFRKYLLLLASWYFYMCWKPELIVLLLASTAVDYFCGLGIERHRAERRRARGYLLASLCVNLGLLFFFKYWNFFGQTLNALCRAVSIPFSAPALEIILPVGISFYTFQTMSYTIDVYRGELNAERDFVSFALFVSFFPQLVAGPIERAGSLLPQLKADHPFSYENAAYGLKLMAWGFFKKLVVADRLAALLVDPVYQDLASYRGGALVIATAAFALQIYCDFSGYSDIARGCARTMGVELMENFKAPYLARTMQDFWRRWHISLTGWFREYVYIPLGGNRKGPWKKRLFVTVTFFLSGLWHGAAWTFVIWGMIHAVYLNLEGMSPIGKQPPPPRGHREEKTFSWWRAALSRAYVFTLASFAWVFFRADSIADALYVLRYSVSGGSIPAQYVNTALRALYPGRNLTVDLLVSLGLLFLFDLINERGDVIQKISRQRVYIRWPAYVLFLLLLLILIPKESAEPFIYFQF